MYFSIETYIRFRRLPSTFHSLYANLQIPNEKEAMLFDTNCGQEYGGSTYKHIYGRPIPDQPEGLPQVSARRFVDKPANKKQLTAVDPDELDQYEEFEEDEVIQVVRKGVKGMMYK